MFDRFPEIPTMPEWKRSANSDQRIVLEDLAAPPGQTPVNAGARIVHRQALTCLSLKEELGRGPDSAAGPQASASTNGVRSPPAPATLPPGYRAS